MVSVKINYRGVCCCFCLFFLLRWLQICNENIFCKDNRMDLEIFNQFLITEPSDSKPPVPDLVPVSNPPALLSSSSSHSIGRVPMWVRPASAGKTSRSFSHSEYWTLNTAGRRWQAVSLCYRWFWTCLLTAAGGSASFWALQCWLLTLREVVDIFHPFSAHGVITLHPNLGLHVL